MTVSCDCARGCDRVTVRVTVRGCDRVTVRGDVIV